jgi:uncharacterized tellurite resistance protein B-like protein
MPNDADRRDLKAALVEVMLLAAASDGSVSQRELETLLGQLLERAEFEGTTPAELNGLVEHSAKRLEGVTDLDALLGSLRRRLPDHETRLLAFGLAAAVALADQRATRAELGLLKTVQAALGIAEDEVVRVIDAIERGRPLQEGLGEPVARLYAEVMVLVVAADGRLQQSEARAVAEALARDRLFAQLTGALAEQYVSEAVTALREQGLPERLQVLARGIRTHEQRLSAFGLAARVSRATGFVSADEQRVLDLLQATFGLDDGEVRALQEKH